MSHEFDGKEYEKASGHQKEWGLRLIEELVLVGNERILDLGCGDGVLTAQLAQRVPDGSVLGVDASEGMIEVARGRATANLGFMLQDINAMSFVEEFDVVFSNATLHWILDHGRLIQQVYRALRKGGFVRFNFAGDGNCSHFFTVIKEAMSHPRYRAYFASFDWPWFMPSVQEYEDLMRRSPFREFRVWVENADRFFPDTDRMIRWVDQPSLVPFVKCVEDKAKKHFRDFVVERMVQATRRQDGRCFETFRRINVLARKA